jgi:AraC family transcriptional regulator
MSALPQPIAPIDAAVERWRYIDGATFLYRDSPKPERCGIHVHDSVLVSFLLKGSIIEVDERAKKIQCEAFSLHSTPPGLRHAHLIQTPRVTTLCFSLQVSFLSQLGPAAKVFDEPVTARRGSVVSLAPKFRREMLSSDSASDLVLQGLVFELAGELARRNDPKLTADAPAWLRRAREMLHDLWNQNVSIEEIAATVGVHPSHLNRVFRTHMNQTPGEYLRRIRMERSTREVLASDLPLKAIAANAGFADQAHFTREFRRHHGISPMEMRRAAREQ